MVQVHVSFSLVYIVGGVSATGNTCMCPLVTRGVYKSDQAQYKAVNNISLNEWNYYVQNVNKLPTLNILSKVHQVLC